MSTKTAVFHLEDKDMLSVGAKTEKRRMGKEVRDDPVTAHVRSILRHNREMEEALERAQEIRKIFKGFETYDEVLRTTTDGSTESFNLRYTLGNGVISNFLPDGLYVDVMARNQVIKPELVARKILRGSLNFAIIKFFQMGLHREIRDPEYRVIWSYDPESSTLMAREDPNGGNPGFEGMFVRK